MKRLIELSNEEARAHFLKESSYFNNDMPRYISFEPILNGVEDVLKGGTYLDFKSSNPKREQRGQANYAYRQTYLLL